MPTNRMSGNLLGVELNGEFVSCEMNCVFTFDAEMRGASPVTAGRWKEVIPGVRSWSIQLDAAMLIRQSGTSVGKILNAFMTGELMNVRFMSKVDPTTTPNFMLSGNAFVSGGSITGAANTKAGWSTTLTGSGPFVVDVNSNVLFALSTGNENEVIGDENKNILVGYGK